MNLELLLSKARQVLMHYDKATDLTAAVLDKSGQAVKSVNYSKQMRFCEFCKKHFHCEEIHRAAFAESKNAGKTYIYACKAGFAYWTSPLFQNGCHAGALSAGQVLLCGRKKAVEKFQAHCKDRAEAEKFKKMLEDTPEKSNEEIQAMARLLGICALEISEKGEYLSKKAGCTTLGEPKNIKWTVNTQTKNHSLRAAGGPGKSLTEPLEEPLENPIEKERMLLAAFQRGDNETGCGIINELMDTVHGANPHNFEMERIRATELLVLLSRAAIAPDAKNSFAVFKASNRNLRRVQESKTRGELMQNLRLAANQMAGNIFSFQGIRHASALRKAQRFIWENFTRKVSLDEISKAVGLSAPYFSAIFKEEMGENLSSYLNRLRVEKAATLLTETGQPLRKIAGLCGFEDQSWFSKIFKSVTGVSPGKYREAGSLIPEFRPGNKTTL